MLTAFSANGSIHFICMDWRHMREVLEAAETPYSELKNLCVWSKSNAGMGSLYRSQHELVFVFKNGTKPHINNVELGRFGRNRTNIWNYAGASSFGSNRDAGRMLHNVELDRHAPAEQTGKAMRQGLDGRKPEAFGI